MRFAAEFARAKQRLPLLFSNFFKPVCSILQRFLNARLLYSAEILNVCLQRVSYGLVCSFACVTNLWEVLIDLLKIPLCSK